MSCEVRWELVEMRTSSSGSGLSAHSRLHPSHVPPARPRPCFDIYVAHCCFNDNESFGSQFAYHAALMKHQRIDMRVFASGHIRDEKFSFRSSAIAAYSRTTLQIFAHVINQPFSLVQRSNWSKLGSAKIDSDGRMIFACVLLSSCAQTAKSGPNPAVFAQNKLAHSQDIWFFPYATPVTRI